MKMMRAPDRDPQYSFKALEATKKFLQDYPDSEFAPIVKEYMLEVQENLAQREFGISTFYASRGNYRASKSRLKELIESYPENSLMDEAYYLYAQSLEKTEDSDGAAAYYAKIAQGYPFSRHFDAAKARLESLGKPVPEVNTLLAAQNQARLKPSEGFSPLKPFTDFAKALGFIGPPDRYESAKEAVLAQKEAAATQAAQAADGEKAGDDILITTTLTKSKSGETEDRTVLGGNAGPAPPAATKKDDKKGNQKKTDEKKSDNKKNPKK
jgi:tetratricopeptide (TPR) repeat protein